VVRACLTGLVLPPFAALACAVPAAAQDEPAGSGRAVVQQLPASETMNLNAALVRLGRNPRDVAALIDAGKAALAIGDVDAATGFFSRADAVSPGNPQFKAGLACAMVRNGNPFGAIPLFDEAARAGITDPKVMIDRGLAYDLVGDNAAAQRIYREALARGPDDEA
jgi:Flp pilus assembly protein TadD